MMFRTEINCKNKLKKKKKKKDLEGCVCFQFFESGDSVRKKRTSVWCQPCPWPHPSRAFLPTPSLHQPTSPNPSFSLQLRTLPSHANHTRQITTTTIILHAGIAIFGFLLLLDFLNWDFLFIRISSCILL